MFVRGARLLPGSFLTPKQMEKSQKSHEKNFHCPGQGTGTAQGPGQLHSKGLQTEGGGGGGVSLPQKAKLLGSI